MLESLTKLNVAIVTLTATVMEYNTFIASELKKATAGAETTAGADENKAPPKKKRTSRKKKAAKTETPDTENAPVEEVEEVEEVDGMNELANDADPSMAGIGQKALEYADVRVAAQAALEQMGSVEVLGALLHDEFKVEKLSAMAATDYPRFIARLNAIVEADKFEDDDLGGIL